MLAARQFRLLLTAILFPILTVQPTKAVSMQARGARWAPKNNGAAKRYAFRLPSIACSAHQERKE